MPVIAMTREIGSRGTEVAAGVARELGLTIVDSEIIATPVAERLGVDEETVLRNFNGSASMFDRWRLNHRKLSRYTSEQILQLVQNNNVVVRGWGAASLLREVPHAIGVRVCAPMEFRIATMLERLGSKDMQAVADEIARYDAAHARTLSAYFNVDQEDACLYHITLNTGRLPIDICVRFVCQLAGHRNAEERPESTLADKLLEAQIQSALTEAISVAAVPSGIIVSARDGRVTLAGMAITGAAVHTTANKVVGAIPGVIEIENRIITTPPRGRQSPL